jgi:hypothetical protein
MLLEVMLIFVDIAIRERILNDHRLRRWWDPTLMRSSYSLSLFILFDNSLSWIFGATKAVVVMRQSPILIGLLEYNVTWVKIVIDHFLSLQILLLAINPSVFFLLDYFLIYLFFLLLCIHFITNIFIEEGFSFYSKAIQFNQTLKGSQKVVNLLLFVKVDAECTQTGHSLKAIDSSFNLI